MAGRRPRGNRRSRAEELFALAAIDPAAHARLITLRRVNPFAYRKELARLVQEGVIPAGRQRAVPAELLALLAQPRAQVLAALEGAEQEGRLTVAHLAALREAEAQERARAVVLGWLDEARARLAAAQNRRL